MALSKKIEATLNQQINEEWFSAYLYKSMAAYFESMNLKGFAHWMNLQTLEELSHGEKFFNFIHDRFGTVKLTAIKTPQLTWKNPLDAVQAALKHEQHITSKINELMTLAQKEHDYASVTFLNWFVTEQVEEEAAADELVEKLKFIGDNKAALLGLDRELGQRTLSKN